MRIYSINNYYNSSYYNRRVDNARNFNFVNEQLINENRFFKAKYLELLNQYKNNTSSLSGNLTTYINQTYPSKNDLTVLAENIKSYIDSEIRPRLLNLNMDTIKNTDIFLKDPKQFVNLINSGLVYISPNLKTINLDYYNTLIKPVQTNYDILINDIQNFQVAQDTLAVI
jgi:hypothetical protein